MRKLFFFCLLLTTAFVAQQMPVQAQSITADMLVGVWEPSHGRAKVKIEKVGNKYHGTIIWLKIPIDPATNKPKLDKNNPDANARKKPLIGVQLLKNFTYEGNGEWENGTIYDPENGKTYSCVINAKDKNTLDIRGYIGIKAIGRTDVWKRVPEPK